MKVPLIGPVKAGKSTYIAALYSLLSEGIPDSGIRFEAQPKSREKLLKLHDALVSCEQVQRTSDSGAFDFPLGVVSYNGKTAELVIPDHAGESFLHQWTHRSLDVEYVKAITDALGILVFLHPTHMTKPRYIDKTLDDLEALILSCSDEQSEDTAEKNDENSRTEVLVGDATIPLEWKPESAPTEVIIVDLLQFVDDIRREGNLPIGVIVSAWDLIEKHGLTPAEWMGEQVPLLKQYLDSKKNEGKDVVVYGISAIGGNLNNEPEKARLLSMSKTSDRAYLICEDNTRTNDVSLPISPFLRK